jgi:hypothetical protein
MRRAFLLALVAGLTVLALSGPLGGPALAKATKTHVSFTDTTSSVSTGREWVSGHVFHSRGGVDAGTVDGDLVGTITLHSNVNVDVNTGRGVVFGKFSLVTADVTWNGIFVAKLSATGAHGRFIGHGTDGSKLRGTFTSIGPGIDQDEAIILSPHG